MVLCLRVVPMMTRREGEVDDSGRVQEPDAVEQYKLDAGHATAATKLRVGHKVSSSTRLRPRCDALRQVPAPRMQLAVLQSRQRRTSGVSIVMPKQLATADIELGLCAHALSTSSRS
jgi:hypothetical protein